MTVMVTGASGVIGRSLVPLMVRLDEGRACVRRPEAADALRALGAKVVAAVSTTRLRWRRCSEAYIR